MKRSTFWANSPLLSIAATGLAFGMIVSFFLILIGHLIGSTKVELGAGIMLAMCVITYLMAVVLAHATQPESGGDRI